jgi:hypothetical protein
MQLKGWEVRLHALDMFRSEGGGCEAGASSYYYTIGRVEGLAWFNSGLCSL